MVLLSIAFLLYLVGAIGVVADGAGEFWLWILAFGLVLDVSILLLALTGLNGLRFINKADIRGKISHVLALLLAGIGLWFRLSADTTWFLIFIGMSLLFWIYSLVILYKTCSRRT